MGEGVQQTALFTNALNGEIETSSLARRNCFIPESSLQRFRTQRHSEQTQDGGLDSRTASPFMHPMLIFGNTCIDGPSHP